MTSRTISTTPIHPPLFYRLFESTRYHGGTTRYRGTVGDSLSFELALALDER